MLNSRKKYAGLTVHYHFDRAKQPKNWPGQRDLLRTSCPPPFGSQYTRSKSLTHTIPAMCPRASLRDVQFRSRRICPGDFVNSRGSSYHCPILKKSGLPYLKDLIFSRIGRGREIRTPDPLLPKQMRYQTALCPDTGLR